MHACMHACMQVSMHLHTHICKHIYEHVHTYVYIYTYRPQKADTVWNVSRYPLSLISLKHSCELPSKFLRTDMDPT